MDLFGNLLTVVRQKVHCADHLGSDRMGPVQITIGEACICMHMHVVYMSLKMCPGHFDKN